MVWRGSGAKRINGSQIFLKRTLQVGLLCTVAKRPSETGTCAFYSFTDSLKMPHVDSSWWQRGRFCGVKIWSNASLADRDCEAVLMIIELKVIRENLILNGKF